jgi:formate C-acetyltransferase
VNDSSPFAGSTTSKFKGVPLYPEFFAQMLWPELSTVSSRPANPFQIDQPDIDRLNRDIFPYWMKHTALELARDRYYQQNQDRPDLNDLKLMQNFVFFMTAKAALISHTIPDFSGPINLGMDQMIRNAQDKMAETHDNSKIEFYSAVMEVLQGIINYSIRLADEAGRLAAKESELKERERLLEIERTYRRVPANPARTFREGLTTIWICWTALHVENANVALSLGRLDQILYDLYRSDVEERGLTPQEATELVCYLWLKIGDHVPAMPEAGEELLGGTGSNQAVTIGGVDCGLRSS